MTHMGNLNLILLVFAFVLTFVAAWWRAPGPFVLGFPHPGWLGLSLYFLSLLIR